MIGLAQKAGKVASGEFSTEKAVKTGKAYTVIVADDSSDNTKKMFSNMCTYYKVPIHFFRASLAILDEGFAKTIEKYFEQGLE